MPKQTNRIEFQVYSQPWSVPNNAKARGCLVADSWDDFGFKTLFNLIVFDEDGEKHEIGYVKIGMFGMKMKSMRSQMPDSFTQLDDAFFSLGQDESYYTALGKLNEWIKRAVLMGLRDIVAAPDRWEKAKEEEVTNTSLLRTITRRTVEKQYRRLVQGGARLTEYDFTYTAPKRMKDGDHRFKLTFAVKPESHPPTNIHVLVGRNGVGKTHLLQLMAKALIAKRSAASQSGAFTSSADTENDDTPLFANLVSVSFSAFDDFELIPERRDSEEAIGYSYIGLRRDSRTGSGLGTPKSPEMLIREFVKSAQLCKRGMTARRWQNALVALESDPIFRAAEVTALTTTDENDFDNQAETLFKQLSSGHKIVLLTLTRLVETVEEQSLVLLDEPEGHLHPPLLSAFIRALSDLMIDRNGVAIVATHSPVVLQEIPRTCVWTLQRTGEIVRAERPEVETFGENLGVLTREVFGYEVTESGFHNMIHMAATECIDFDEAVARFNGELGAEAKAILRGLFTTGN